MDWRTRAGVGLAAISEFGESEGAPLLTALGIVESLFDKYTDLGNEAIITLDCVLFANAILLQKLEEVTGIPWETHVQELRDNLAD